MWNYIAWCTTVNLTLHDTFTISFSSSVWAPLIASFFVSTLLVSSSIMYVDSLLPHTFEYFHWCNWLVPFYLQTFAKWFFFLHFPHLPLMLGNFLRIYVFPFSHSIHKMLFLSSSLIVSFSISIICLIISWLITLLPIPSSVTHFLLFIALHLDPSQLLLCYFTVLTNHCYFIYCSDGSLNMRARTPAFFVPTTNLSVISSTSN